jgi:putative flippase GtrA
LALAGSAIRYTISSAASFVISFGTPIFLHEAVAVAPQLAVAIGLILAFVFNFLSGKYFIYRSGGPIWREFASYAVVNAAFRGLEYGCFTLLYLNLGLKYYIANFVVILASFPIKFFVYNFTVYATPRVNRAIERDTLP